jgi:hypothetical protein
MADVQAGAYAALVSEGYDLQAANFAAPGLVTSLRTAASTHRSTRWPS